MPKKKTQLMGSKNIGLCMTKKDNIQDKKNIPFGKPHYGDDFEKIGDDGYRKDTSGKAAYDPKFSIIKEKNKNPFHINFTTGKDLLRQPKPMGWLIKGWIPESSIGMIHGASGVGKTFFMLDMLLSIANQKTEWNGQKVKNGNVLYMAGEGKNGLQSRIALYMQEKGNIAENALDITVSDRSIPLNNSEALECFKEQLRTFETVPSLIVFDTLHRFLEGDENSAKDAGSFIRACEEIKSEFGCSIVLVHHTGLNSDAKDRARGSSAWRGAMDFEIGVKKGNSSHQIIVTQLKMKDAELRKPISFEMKKQQIDNWFDEDYEPVTSLYLVLSDIQENNNRYNAQKIKEKRELFKRIWEYHERPTHRFDDGEETPVITKAEAHNFLKDVEHKSTQEIRVILNVKQKSRLISSLVDNKLISILNDKKKDDEILYIVNDDYWREEMMQTV
jgi:archaellum biogenesis ATPase FlaH